MQQREQPVTHTTTWIKRSLLTVSKLVSPANKPFPIDSLTAEQAPTAHLPYYVVMHNYTYIDAIFHTNTNITG